MTVTNTDFPDLKIIEPRIFKDDRGYFFESFNANVLKENNIALNFLQDNQSKSSYGVIRGLHFQKNPHAQTKLIRVLEGEIYDVVVDLRKSSPKFGEWMGIHLSAENKKQFLVPQGFAHGFSVLSETAAVLYKCDDFYHPETEGGLLYNDPKLNIDWKIPTEKALVSGKDLLLPTIDKLDYTFE